MLDGKVALITGAASGIGRAAAWVFARYGARLALLDLEERGESGRELALQLVGEGHEALFLRADVREEADVRDAVAATVATFGVLHCAFNNAGIDGLPNGFRADTNENWSRVLETNLVGVRNCMRSEVAAMEGVRGAAIVNNSSVLGLVAWPGLSAYTTSKHAVLGLTKAVALEIASHGVRVNAVCPGGILTPILQSAVDRGVVTLDELAKKHPIRRLGHPTEVAEAAAWLCSDRSSYVVGHELVVDGGWVAI
jgi:NAD(P)-dependent dehydrogenase (short-subunit alcohol dehydrogenase family)